MRYMKFKTLLGVYGLILLSGLIQSCCEEEITITSFGSMEAWRLYEDENGYMDRESISTVTGEFILGTYFVEEISSLNNVSLMSSSYALSCKETRINSVDKSSLDLSMNKGFVLNGDSVLANTNLLEIENLGVELQDMAGGNIEFRFTESFFSNTTLENGSYIFKFNGSTDDNVQLTSEMSLEILL